ncbi:MAG: hypothetical protein C0503_01050 [Gemmatimonas sp.]|nr:hypothetical protein [Gemmatimonas sp.]
MPRIRHAVTLLLAISALALPLRAASAHPRLLKATPAADSRAAEAPREIRLTFNEAVDVALTRVTLLRGDTPVRLDSLRLAVGDDHTVIAPIGLALTPGRYTLRWQVSGDDGHPVRGEFSFEVLAADAPVARPTHSAHP